MVIGITEGVSMEEYLALDAVSSTHIDWIHRSPLHYRHCREHPPKPTKAMDSGTAVHMAVFEPDRFARTYALEPDVDAIGGANPRATKAYKDGCKEVYASGRLVMRRADMFRVLAMAEAVRTHPVAKSVLKLCPRHEVVFTWRREDGRLCKARADAMGEKAMTDLKQTADLANFSPWVITKLGYHRRAAWYADGMERLGSPLHSFMFIAVEPEPPYDVGVFAIDDAALYIGKAECEHALGVLDICEKSGEWPGMYPTIVKGTVTDAVANRYVEEVEA